jgi:hypothetical protein
MNRGAESVLQPQAQPAATEGQQEQFAAAQTPLALYQKVPLEAGDYPAAAHTSSRWSTSCQQLQQQGADASTDAAATPSFTAATEQVAGSCSAWDVLSQRISRDVSEVLLSGKGSLTASEFEAVTQDVAARIIQTHWHLYRQRRLQQQQQQQEALPQHQGQKYQDVQQQPLWQHEQHCVEVSSQLQPAQHEMAKSHAQLLVHSLQEAPECTYITDGSCSSSNDIQQEDSPAAQQHNESEADIQQENLASATQQQPFFSSVAAASPCSSGAVQHAMDASEAAAAAEPSTSCNEQSNRSQALVPQVSAAALGKLRASAGSRNAARLQQCRHVGASAVHPQQMQPALLAQLAAVAPVCAGGSDSQQVLQQQSAQEEVSSVAVAAAGSSPGAGSGGMDGRDGGIWQAQQHTQQEQQNLQQQQPAGAAKLSAILAYLDAVEASVETEGGSQGTQLR